MKAFKPTPADFLSNGVSLGTEMWISQKPLEMFSDLVISSGCVKATCSMYLQIGFGFALHHQVAQIPLPFRRSYL
jgi:hypothetical protein